MRVAIAQADCRLGDVDGNLDDAEGWVRRAAGERADLVVFPELGVNGYAQGAVDGDTSLGADDARLRALSRHGPDVLVGFVEDSGLRLFNSVAYLSGGATVHVQRKLYLPNYLMWEERKHFSPGNGLRAFATGHGTAATLVCNDAWQPMLPWIAAQDGAELLLVPANSAAVADGATGGGPVRSIDNGVYWRDLVRHIARMQQCWVVFVNRVGRENGVEFWGGSEVVDPSGEATAQAPLWESALLTVDIDIGAARRHRRALPLLQDPRFDLLTRELQRLAQEDTRR